MDQKEVKNPASHSFYRNIALLLFVNLLIKPIYILGIDAQVQNAVGESAYGIYFGIFNFCMLFQIILDPGILNYNNQLISKNNAQVEELFARIAGSKIMLVGAYLMLVVLGAIIIGFPNSYFMILMGVGLILVLSSFLNYLRSHFSALGKYSYEGLFSGLDKTLMIIIIGYFLYVKKDVSISTFIAGQIVALAISCIIFLIFLKKLFKPKLVFSIPDTFQLVKRTAPYALVLLLMTIYTRLDGLMLERLLNDEGYSAGVYATGFRLLDAANMIGILFAMLMLPMFSKIIGEKEKLMVLVEEVTKLLFVITLLVCLISWFYSEEIINLIYTNNTDMHYKVYKYLMLGFFAMGMSNIFGCLFLAKEKLKQINWLFFFGILLNIALNFYFIPKYLAFGAVIATLITQFFVFIGQIWLATQEFSLKYSAKAMIGFVVILVVGYLLFYIGREYIGLQWIIELILISFLVIVLSFLCGFLRSPLGFSK